MNKLIRQTTLLLKDKRFIVDELSALVADLAIIILKSSVIDLVISVLIVVGLRVGLAIKAMKDARSRNERVANARFLEHLSMYVEEDGDLEKMIDAALSILTVITCPSRALSTIMFLIQNVITNGNLDRVDIDGILSYSATNPIITAIRSVYKIIIGGIEEKEARKFVLRAESKLKEAQGSIFNQLMTYDMKFIKVQ